MHLDEGSKIYRAIGDCAPAFGMIGTLIGMVQMFANMTDPSKLGPFMATALLATLYGALVANLFCLPIADKLHLKLLDEETNRTLIIDGILMIRDSKSPTLVREMLMAYLPEKHRHEEASRCRPDRQAATGRENKRWQRKTRRAHGGGHGWFVTFADLMGLMMSFFVMLVAFSTMDNNKLKIVAGSMRDAFGVQTEVRYSGIIESDGLPTRPKLKNAEHIAPEEASATPTPDEQDQTTSSAPAQGRSRIRARLGVAAAGVAGHAGTDRDFQAHHVRGDQGGPQPRDRRPGRPLDVRRRLQGALRAHPPADPEARRRRSRRRPAGFDRRPHRAGNFVPTQSDYGAFDLSADRANAVRQILEREGLPPATSLPSRERPTPSRCFPTIPRCRPTAASPSR
jgi:hypothetical protein